MSVIQVRLSERIIKLWINKAIGILMTRKDYVCFESVLNEIKQFNDNWIVIGLGKQDIEDIKSVYNTGDWRC